MGILVERSKQNRTKRNYLNLRLRRLEIEKAKVENEAKNIARAMKDAESSHVSMKKVIVAYRGYPSIIQPPHFNLYSLRRKTSRSLGSQWKREW